MNFIVIGLSEIDEDLGIACGPGFALILHEALSARAGIRCNP
ncbi:hypothetical protein [Mucilaginibacter sp. L196]|nr:hypothetical protein [Mucilaginibacter sp. L196]